MKLKQLLSFKFFLYASLVGLLVYIFREGEIAPVHVHHIGPLLLSIGLLMGGFFLLSWIWLRSLHPMSKAVRWIHAFVSINLGSMGKYIPGKVAILHGISAYLHESLSLSRKQTALRFVQFHLVYILTGFLTGAALLSSLSDAQQLYYGIWIAVMVGILIGFGPLMQLTFRILGRFSQRFVLTEPLPRFGTANVLLMLGVWFFWGTGFWALAWGLSADMPALAGIFSFPFAASVGNLVIIAPGGLGVREGILDVILQAQGITQQDAHALAITSRLWFLVGELTMFVAAGIYARRGRSISTDKEETARTS